MRLKIVFFLLLFTIVDTYSCESTPAYMDSLRHYYRQMLHQPFPKKYQIAGRFQNLINNYCTPAEVKEITDEMHALAKSEKDEKLALDAELARIVFQFHKDTASKNLGLDQPFINLIDKSRKSNALYIELIAKHVLAEFVYWRRMENYQLAFETYLDLERQLDKISAFQFPHKMHYLYLIGYAYYKFQDYNSAERFMNKAIRQPLAAEQPVNLWRALNTLGLIHQKQEHFTISNQFFRSALQVMSHDSNSIYFTITGGNLGYNYFLNEQFDKALPLLVRDYDNAIKYGDLGLAAGALIPIADMNIEKGNFTVSTSMLQEAKKYIDSTSQTHRNEELYRTFAKLYAAQGMYKLSTAYLDSAIDAKETQQKHLSGITLLRAEQKHNLELADIAEDSYKIKVNAKQTERNYLGLLLVLITVTSATILYFQRKQFDLLRRQKIAKLEKTESELNHANNLLQKMAYDISGKNRLIEKLEREGYSEKDEILDELQKSVILTEEDWLNFKSSFNKVYPGFIQRIKEKHLGITPAEIRLLTLYKLKYTNKEMAAMLGISANAINVTWHRLRKKLSISEKFHLEEFSENI